VATVWEEIDFLLLPTTGTIYSISEVEENPIQLNTNLGILLSLFLSLSLSLSLSCANI